ncbi:SDR family NAD(P)-dependent oxidoreductase [Pseudonocardia endophytica]|uniref:NAD(P)-dependent dehydrogenase (Short-subunit alcohol dehydrogenase family) n=1 Tax=Pseudonocardia endophytica TaxID=401976 RepID=A0A4V2PJ34_PSEEN|nr:SDR family oxidoreductase [Pseudonocardia endophytica]TCK26966.1 NAD(P)-dependent dehydrogenase (short-subunit alcohol dehydrogenase family) [Pseudonocardia endophytica]
MTAADDPGAALRLDGRVAVVTGASSGLGAHFARTLARAGADVAVAARRQEMLESVAAGVLAEGRRCLAVPTDVTDAAQCTRLVDTVVSELGGVDVLVNNAGTGYAARSERDEPARAARLIEVNLTGAYQMAVAAGRAMIAGGGGAIVNISSALALTAADIPQAAYSASKAGLLGMTRDLARQWARHGIRVNALAPGFFDSEMTAPLLSDEAGLATVNARTPLGRTGRLDELVGPLLLLASDAGSYITGTTMSVDGGLAMH